MVILFLSSGLHSPKYVQCAQLLSKPKKKLLKYVTILWLKKLKQFLKNFDLILSPAMGGIIVGYDVGRILNKETIFSERVDGILIKKKFFNKKK